MQRFNYAQHSKLKIDSYKVGADRDPPLLFFTILV